MRVTSLDQDVLFGPDYEERRGEREPVETLEVDVVSIQDIEGTRFGDDLVMSKNSIMLKTQVIRLPGRIALRRR
jgi:hypothetical protein